MSAAGWLAVCKVHLGLLATEVAHFDSRSIDSAVCRKQPSY
jgi:hypothetical protein